MSGFSHFAIVSVLSLIVAGGVLRFQRSGLTGPTRQFYLSFVFGLISIGVLSIIATILYMMLFGDSESITQICARDPKLISEADAAFCESERSKLLIPLFTGVGGMMLYFCAALVLRVNHTKKSGMS